MPILASHHIPNNISNVDASGRLTDKVWRVDAEPNDNWEEESENTGNTLREEILNRVDGNHFAHDHNYK